jgi:S1-C subfamily serine protease
MADTAAFCVDQLFPRVPVRNLLLGGGPPPLVAVAADGPFANLGLRSGEVLISINGMSLTTAQQVLDAYGKLKTTRQLNLGLVRTGRETSLEYSIR